jgi:L-cysteate sulfo-lyase
VITMGALQSNHVRQTAAAAAKLGLACEVILVRLVVPREPAYETSGNLLLDDLLGARVHPVADVEEAVSKLGEITERLHRENHTTYVIPPGGSNPVGALGYVNCAIEIAGQAEPLNLAFDTIIHASSSCGTQSGLVVGLASLNSTVRLLGINVSHQDGDLLLAELDELCTETAEFTGIPALAPGSICVNDDFLGEGYGIPTPETLEAIHMVARLEGILLDPVYTGKAMAGLIGLIRRGHFSKNQSVLFIHTGGSAGLFAYRDLLMNETGSI